MFTGQFSKEQVASHELARTADFPVGPFAGWKTVFLASWLVALLGPWTAHGQTSQSAGYTLLHHAEDAGGGVAMSASYSLVSSLGQVAGIGEGGGGAVTARQGFPGQLNDPPQPYPDRLERNAGQGVKVPLDFLLANDVDPEGDTVQWWTVEPTSANGGTVTVADGCLQYAPPAGSNDTDSFAYTVSDAAGNLATATVQVQVNTGGLYDYGDLAASFNTDGGGDPANAPRHLLGIALSLGKHIDAEATGQASLQANGDDAGGWADEDGVRFGPLTAGRSAAITVTVSGTLAMGLLNAWMDWNRDGTFQESERVFANQTVTPGANLLNLTVPADAPIGPGLAARFRLSSAGNDLPASGTAGDGEIEDYSATVIEKTTAATLAYFTVWPGESGGVLLSWGTLVEVQTLGFIVERREETGWRPVTVGLTPATGYDHRPQHYRLDDPIGGTEYRLVEVDTAGGRSVLAHALVSTGPHLSARLEPDGLWLTLRGESDRALAVEMTGDLVNGPWLRLQTLVLDATGQAALRLDGTRAEPRRFYRAVEP